MRKTLGLFLVLASCTSSRETNFSLQGTVSYESVSPVCDPNCHLDYSNIQTLPIRNANINIVVGTNVIATTKSDAIGHYSVNFSGSGARLLVLAEVTDPPIRVLDNTLQDSGYALQSEVIADGTTSLDMTAKLGWDSSRNTYTVSRASPPFALLDTAHAAYDFCLAGRRLTLTPLDIYWSVDNRPENGDVTDGQITTSNWNGSALYILGKADIDTDEFDSHVITHEWTHYMMQTLSKLDSLGGVHQEGDILDLRLSLHEGLANANSGIVLHDPIYIDTSGTRQQDGFSLDLDANHTGDAHPGWFSEFSIQTIVYDLVDAGAETWDHVAISPSALYDVLLGYFKDAAALSSIYSLITGLKATQSISVNSAIDTLVADRSITTITDDYGTGETNNGGDPNNLPLYRDIDIGAVSASFALTGAVDGYNKATSNRYFRLTGNGSTLVAKATCDVEGIGVIVYDQEKAYSDNNGQLGETSCSAGVCSFSVTFPTSANNKYVINILDDTDVAATHHCTVSLKNSTSGALLAARKIQRIYEQKTSAPVQIRADLKNSMIAIDFSDSAKDIVVSIRGIDGLQMQEVSLQQAVVEQWKTLSIPVQLLGRGILVVQVRGIFNDVPMHKVVSFDIGTPTTKHAKPGAAIINGKRWHILGND